jgi:hypothetical protein
MGYPTHQMTVCAKRDEATELISRRKHIHRPWAFDLHKFDRQKMAERRQMEAGKSLLVS